MAEGLQQRPCARWPTLQLKGEPKAALRVKGDDPPIAAVRHEESPIVCERESVRICHGVIQACMTELETDYERVLISRAGTALTAQLTVAIAIAAEDAEECAIGERKLFDAAILPAGGAHRFDA